MLFFMNTIDYKLIPPNIGSLFNGFLTAGNNCTKIHTRRKGDTKFFCHCEGVIMRFRSYFILARYCRSAAKPVRKPVSILARKFNCGGDGGGGDQ